MSAEPETTGGMDATPERTLRNAVLIVYVLQAAALMLGFTLVIGVVINHALYGRSRGTWLESHFRWQIMTFWIFFMWAMFGALTLKMAIGYPVILAAVAWLIYRFIRGWSRLNANQPVGVPLP